MSAVTSPNSPRSGLSSDDLFGFDGGDELCQAWRDGLAARPGAHVSEWADRHRLLSPRASAEPGRYRTDRTPYIRAIVDALSPTNPTRRVVVMKSAQVGFTEGGNNWIGYVIHHAPGPMLAVQPTVELAKRFSRQRIDPLISESPALRERVKPARSRDAGNTVLSKEFPAGLLVITGANSAVGLRSMPARYLFLDEVDAYPPSADEEGDPVALAEARTRTFSWRSKVFLGSTPTIHGLSRIEREYEATDQRRFFVPCPHCEEKQWLRFERLRWEKGRPETTHYICACLRRADRGAPQDRDACRWPLAGDRRGPDPGTIGFHLSALYSPVGWLSWEQHRPDVGGRDNRRGQAQFQERRARRDLDRDRRGAGLAAALRASRKLADRHGAARRSVPDRRRGRPEGPHRSRHLGLGSRPRKLARRSHCDRRRPGACRDLGCAALLLGRTWPHAGGTQLGLAKLAIDTGYEARRLCLGASHGARAGRADQRRRGLQPIRAGRWPNACRCDRGRQEAAPWCAALDHRGRDVQERDLSLPAPHQTDR